MRHKSPIKLVYHTSPQYSADSRLSSLFCLGRHKGPFTSHDYARGIRSDCHTMGRWVNNNL